MSKTSREEIISVALKLASEKGLANVSMGMIAESVGIKKPSLYNHFESKEKLFESMYEFLRENAKAKASIGNVHASYADKTPFEILFNAVGNYIEMNKNEDMRAFYKVVYSERCYNKLAAKILVEETERMIAATKSLFEMMQSMGIMRFEDIKEAAISYALTVHGLMDYSLDCEFIGKSSDKCKNMIKDYIKSFCAIHEVKEKR